jgi:hypothetical protein
VLVTGLTALRLAIIAVMVLFVWGRCCSTWPMSGAETLL